MGVAAPEVEQRQNQLLKKFGLPVRLPAVPREQLLNLIHHEAGAAIFFADGLNCKRPLIADGEVEIVETLCAPIGVGFSDQLKSLQSRLNRFGSYAA